MICFSKKKIALLYQDKPLTKSADYQISLDTSETVEVNLKMIKVKLIESFPYHRLSLKVECHTCIIYMFHFGNVSFSVVVQVF